MRHIWRSFFLLGAIFVFTFFDWLVHQTSPILEVPSWYFRNKIIFGTVWACISGFFVLKYSIKIQAAIITIVTVTLLQLRYFFYGYSWEFHAIIFPAHMILLFASSYLALQLERKMKKKKSKKK